MNANMKEKVKKKTMAKRKKMCERKAVGQNVKGRVKNIPKTIRIMQANNGVIRQRGKTTHKESMKRMKNKHKRMRKQLIH